MSIIIIFIIIIILKDTFYQASDAVLKKKLP